MTEFYKVDEKSSVGDPVVDEEVAELLMDGDPDDGDPVEVASSVDDYLTDDEAFLGDDKILEETQASTIVQQLEGVVSWKIEGLYDENSMKRRSPRQLRMDPPVFTIDSTDSGSGSFYVSRDMAEKLAASFKALDRAYKGLPEHEDTSLNLASIKKWIVNHWLLTAMLAFFVLYMLLFPMFR